MRWRKGLLERDKKLLAIQAAKPLGTVADKMIETVAAKLAGTGGCKDDDGKATVHVSFADAVY